MIQSGAKKTLQILQKKNKSADGKKQCLFDRLTLQKRNKQGEATEEKKHQKEHQK